MPTISRFYGITIAMYHDEGHHLLPHFHARYGEFSASFTFDGAALAGWLPPRAVRLVAEWAALHGDDLATNWQLAREDAPLHPIDPLA